jgi:hypothetical protein
MLPSSAMTWSRDTASVLPTTSLISCGRYFSTWSATQQRRERPACVAADILQVLRTHGSSKLEVFVLAGLSMSIAAMVPCCNVGGMLLHPRLPPAGGAYGIVRHS